MKSKKDLFDRGFKAKAENLSIEYREKLGMKAWQPLCAFELAKFLNIIVVTPSQIFSSTDDISILCGTADSHSDWSALVTENLYGQKLIIHNHLHSTGRQQSNIMHEIAHMLCCHTIPNSYKDLKLPSSMIYKNPKQEAEAEFLGAALQISKACLFWALKRNMTHAQIATHFNASEDMVKYRINASGVAKQRYYMSKKD